MDNRHHGKTVTMRLRMKNGKLATNAKQNIEVASDHLEKVYNSQCLRYLLAAKLIKQREPSLDLDSNIVKKEFK